MQIHDQRSDSRNNKCNNVPTTLWNTKSNNERRNGKLYARFEIIDSIYMKHESEGKHNCLTYSPLSAGAAPIKVKCLQCGINFRFYH